MKVSDIMNESSILINDGYFDILAQCVVKSDKKILTFLDDLKYIDVINNNHSISCIICKIEHINFFKNSSMGILCVEQPRLFFFEVHNKLAEKIESESKKVKTIIGSNCKISPLSSISNSNVVIGNNVIIEEFVSIKENVTIGDNSIIRAGSIIGGQGYEFKRNKQEDILTVKHVGKTIIGSNVEIKECCTIHRAVFDWDYTMVGDYSKIDAHSHIGHGTKVGKRVMIGSHGNLAGNICVEDDVYIGPGAVISNRITLKKGCKISLGSVVTKDVSENQIVTGNFAIDHNIFIKDLKEKVNKYEKEVSV